MSQTFLPNPIQQKIYSFAVALAQAGRVFTLPQLSRHPELSWRTQPEKAASKLLRPYRDSFEVLPWLSGNPYLWRLSEREKRRRGLRYRNVRASQKTPHWLAIGDVWMELVFNGLRPTKWFTEGKEIGRFDVFAEIRGKPYLMEIQLSHISDEEWTSKWNARNEWLQLARWNETEWSKQFSSQAPTVYLVTSQPMKVLLPREGVTYVRRFTDLHSTILRPPR